MLTPAIKKLYLDAKTADIIFPFKSANDRCESIPAHKSFLIAISTVFRRMFDGISKEKNCIQITDTTSSAFKDFLQFFYFEEVSISMETVAAVMHLGQKYNVGECVTACASFLSDNLTDQNACWVYGLAVQFNHDELQKLCEVTIGIGTSTVLQSNSFLKCDRKIVARILKLQSLSCDERELFNATMTWVMATVKQRYLNSDIISAQLGQSFHDIRFELMTMNDFTQIFSTYETLFSADQRRNIIQKIASKEFDTNMGIKCGRKFTWYKLPFIECERDNSRTIKPYDIQEIEVETFSINKPLLLRGIICCDIFHFTDGFSAIIEDIPGQIKIYEFCGAGDDAMNGLRLVYDDSDIELECGDNEYNMWLNKPIIIKPEKMYQIRLALDMDDNICTNIKMKDNRAYSNGFIVTFHTERDRGLISGLKFNPYGMNGGIFTQHF